MIDSGTLTDVIRAVVTPRQSKTPRLGISHLNGETTLVDNAAAPKFNPSKDAGQHPAMQPYVMRSYASANEIR